MDWYLVGLIIAVALVAWLAFVVIHSGAVDSSVALAAIADSVQRIGRGIADGCRWLFSKFHKG